MKMTTRGDQHRGAFRATFAKGAIALMGVAVAVSTFSLGAVAQEVRVSTATITGHPWTLDIEEFVKRVNANPNFQAKMFGIELLTMAEVPAGIRDGITDMGTAVTAYHPAEYSESNMAADLGMLATSGEKLANPGMAMQGAVMEYVFFNCPECLEQVKAQSAVYLGSVSTPPYSLLCRTPIRNVADIKGKKLRTGAAAFTRWAEGLGAQVVSVTGGEQYEALSQGIIDCSMVSAGELQGASLYEVTKSVIENIPGGLFTATHFMNVNGGKWNGFTAEQRAFLISEMPRLMASTQYHYQEAADNSIDKLDEWGIENVAASQDLVDYTNKFVEGDTANTVKAYTEKYGLKNVETKVAKVAELIQKWKGLVKTAGNDIDAMAAVYKSEIFDKLPADYGLN